MATDRLINSTQGDAIIAALETMAAAQGLSISVTPARLDGDAVATVTINGTAVTLYSDPHTADFLGKQDKIPATGAANKGVYVSSPGVLAAMAYELNKSVPENAVFTDTTYSPAVPGGANGLMTGADKAKLDRLNVPDDGISMPVILASQTLATFTSAAAGRPLRITAHIQPVQAAGTPSPENPLPISGASSVTVTRAGRNLLYRADTSSITDNGITWTPNADGTVTANGTSTAQSRFYFSAEALGAETTVYMRTTDGNIAGYCDAFGNITNNNVRTISAGRNPGNIFLYVGAGKTLNNAVCSLVRVMSGDDGSVERGVRDSVTTPLIDASSNPLIVYGATLDLEHGLLTVTHGQIASYSGETLPGAWMSSKDVYTPGGTPTTGAQVVYELAAPVTYLLTPQRLTTLDGTNNVFADCGPVTVTHWPGTGTPVEPVEDGTEIAWKKGILDRITALEGG